MCRDGHGPEATPSKAEQLRTPSKSARNTPYVGGSAHSARKSAAAVVAKSACAASGPTNLQTLASLRAYQLESLKDALQEQFSSAVRSHTALHLHIKP